MAELQCGGDSRSALPADRGQGRSTFSRGRLYCTCMIAARSGNTNSLSWAATLAAGALLAGACAGSRAGGPPSPNDRGCSAVPATTATASADSVSVVLTWPIEPRTAPRPENPGERFVYELGYETLVRIDCLGRVTPALASSWTIVDGGTQLVLTLRDSARFWNGDPLTAQDVIASWRAAGQRRLADNAVVSSEHTLQLGCNAFGETGSRDCPVLAALGDAGLAVTRSRPGVPWPEGTGPYRLQEPLPTPSGTARRTMLRLAPVRDVTLPRLTIHSVRDAEARDFVDAGADLVLTDDPTLASYASARSDVISLTLPWDRTWSIVTPTRRVGSATGEQPIELDPTTIDMRTEPSRASLARDVVRSDARAGEGPYWWRDMASCPSAPAPTSSSSERLRSRVVARSDQSIARALAERLVALAATPRGSTSDSLLTVLAPLGVVLDARFTAISVPPNDFATTLRSGSDAIYLLPVRRHSLAPCLDAEWVRLAAPWLASYGRGQTTSLAFVPLVDTRLHAVVRRDRLGLAMTWDSTVAVSQP